MAIEVSLLVWKWSKQSGTRLLLLVAIADYANAEGIAWPSIQSLSKRTRMTPRYVQKMLREIEQAGELEIIKRTATSNVYRVSIRRPDSGIIEDELPFTPGVNSSSGGGEPGFAKGVNPSSPNPSREPSKNHTPANADAERIYQAYPRKVGKNGALKAIDKALKSVSAPQLLTATIAYSAAVSLWSDNDKKYIPHPATWFTRGSYEDDPINWQRSNSPNGNTRTQKPNSRDFEMGARSIGTSYDDLITEQQRQWEKDHPELLAGHGK